MGFVEDIVSGGVGDVVHGATDLIGLTDYEGQEAAAAAAETARRESLALTETELAFQREQYYDWKDIYGTTQEQIFDYTQKLTGEDLVAQQLATSSQEFQLAEKGLSQTLAQRGISGSGTEAAGLTNLAAQEAAQRATIRSSQEKQAIDQQMQLLGIGLGQGTTMLGTQAAVAQTGIGSQASIAGQQSALSGQLGSANIQSTSNVLGQIGGGFAAAFSDRRLKDNIKLIKTIGKYNIYEWDWNDTATRLLKVTGKATGVIAQELLDINPNLVFKEDDYYAIKIDKLPKEVQEEINYAK